jgi:hypothetical protein
MVLSLGYFRGITMRLYLIAGLACLAATPALAQSQYTRQVNTQLDAMESNARNNGQTRLFRSPIFQLNEGQTQTYPISLVRGRAYTIGGVCDVDCPDLDIKLIDPNGREVATDVLTDSVPLVSHTATMSGDYRVRVIMYDCNVAPCSAGLTIMGSSGGGARAPLSTGAGQYDQQVTNQLDTFERGQSGATRLFRSPIFRLNEGATQDYPVTMIAGVPYKIAGVCDNDCPDLDIKLLDSNGRELASDSLTDSLPIVSYRPGQSGEYRVRVVMYDCNVAPCSAGLTVMATGPASTNSGSSGTSSFDQQVISQLDTMEANASGMSRLFRSPIFRLNEGATQDYPIDMRAGQRYMIGGVCDNDCPDLDIKLIDPSGNEVAEDTATDSVPIVNHSPSKSGTYKVRVVMYDCNTAPCSAGLTIMGTGGGAAVRAPDTSVNRPAPTAGQYDAQVNSQLDSFERGQSSAVRLFRSPIFRLNEGADRDFVVTLIAGVNYKIAGVCDNDCPDLDIKLIDQNGNTLASDALTDSLPIVDFRPTRGGAYRVRMVMYDCNNAPCSAGVTVMATN